MNQVEKNIELLKIISDRIKSFDFEEVSEEELSILIKNLEKIVRAEWSKYYQEFFSDLLLADKLVSLYKTVIFENATKINLLSLIGNMIKRYELLPTKELFELFYELKYQKEINYYVSLYIMQFPDWEGKWEYLLSIPEIAPKVKSERNFYVELEKIVNAKETIPKPYKNKFLIVLRELADKAGNDFYKNEYLDLLAKMLSDEIKCN